MEVGDAIEKSAALQQIKDKEYAGSLKDYTDNLLLVGISYDKDKGHTCAIERYKKQSEINE